MRAVRTVTVGIEVDPVAAGIPIRSANGQLTSDGQAQGSAVLAFNGGAPLEYQLVVTGGVFYLRGPTGPFTPLPRVIARTVFDPTAILDADRGIAVLLSSADAPVTRAREEVDGVDTFRVDATFRPQPVATLVPAVQGPVPGSVSVDAATFRVVRAVLQVPDGPGGAKGGPVTVRLSDYDAPVTVTRPA